MDVATPWTTVIRHMQDLFFLFPSTEQSLVLLLRLNEGLLEKVGIYRRDQLLQARVVLLWVDLLSLLENRMARVCGSGSPSLTSAAAFHTQLRSLPTFGESFISGTTAILLNSVPGLYDS